MVWRGNEARAGKKESEGSGVIMVKGLRQHELRWLAVPGGFSFMITMGNQNGIKAARVSGDGNQVLIKREFHAVYTAQGEGLSIWVSYP